VEKSLTCLEGTIEPDLPLCESRAELPCVKVSEARIAGTRYRVRHAIKAVKKLEGELKRRYPKENENYNVTHDLITGMLHISKLLQDARKVANSCTQLNPRCHPVKFPREELMRSFKQSFGPRPAKGRTYFRAVRKYNVKRFRTLLMGFPEYLVKCE
jgi:hypothetical protein